jgi:MHS family alpha-ketoglutarate permease-like MFS transporter
MVDEVGQGPGITAAGGTLTPLRRVKAILGGSAGNLVEWYDWFAYSAFTLYFADHFFPKGDQTAQLLQAAAIFAVGFLARPIGAWAMGVYADRIGRRAALALAVALMSLGSFAIAFIPSYATIGVWAPACLMLARVLQGLSVGGEYGASATYMSEMAGKSRRGFWSSFQYVTLIMGQLAATVVLLVLQHTLTKAELSEWGWRIPFAIGGVLAVVVFWVQTSLEESASFKNVAPEHREKIAPSHMRWVLGLLVVALAACAAVFNMGLPLTAAMSWSVAILVVWQLSFAAPLFARHPREVPIVVGLTAAGSLAFYAYTTYMPKFLVNTAGFTKDAATAVSAGSLLVYMCVNPIMGHLSDRFGRRATLIGAFSLGTLLTYPIFTALSTTHSQWAAFGLVTSLCLIHSGYSSVSAVVKSELFPAAIRGLGVALPYAIGNTIFGGTAEYVALWFKKQSTDNALYLQVFGTGSLEGVFFLYVSAVMFVALIISVRLRDTNKTSLIEED